MVFGDGVDDAVGQTEAQGHVVGPARGVEQRQVFGVGVGAAAEVAQPLPAGLQLGRRRHLPLQFQEERLAQVGVRLAHVFQQDALLLPTTRWHTKKNNEKRVCVCVCG